MHALLATVQALAPEDLLLAISYSEGRRELNGGGRNVTRRRIWPYRFLPTPCSSAPPLSVYDCRASDAQRRYLLDTCANDVDRLFVYGAVTTGFRAGAGAYSP